MRHLVALVVAAMTSHALGQTQPVQPVPFTAVRFSGGFWEKRLETTRTGTLRANFDQCEKTGRVENLRQAGLPADQRTAKFQGYFFNDSDVYKALEGACYQLALKKDPALEAEIDTLIETIARAQQPDGYINAYFTLGDPSKRWTKESDMHETYCIGHLIEAGVAHYQATGKRTLLDVAIKAADHVATIYGPGKRDEAPGHEEIELALIKLSHATGDPRYTALASFFVECRGRPRPTPERPEGTVYGEYCQDNIPVRDMTEVVGHAVRAMYLFMAMTDLAAANNDHGYTAALDRVWDDLTLRKVYITGGIGSSASNEGFTVPYDLPNDTAYAESCAGIGLAMWAHRMSLLHADARYFDTFERVLYNGMLSSVSLAGDKFFYVNPLASTGNHHRLDWYSCACCPPNILRFLSSLGGYAYATRGNDAYINLYANGSARLKLDGGEMVIDQRTDYPWDGKITITAQTSTSLKNCNVYFRIPGWCAGATWKINGIDADPKAIVNGYSSAALQTEAGVTIELTLPMPARYVHANPRVHANIGRAAIERGPVVYCLETADNAALGAGVRNLAVLPDAPLTSSYRSDLLGGVVAVQGEALAVPDIAWDADVLYAPAPALKQVRFTAIPYFAWDNREPGDMTVWLPESPAMLIKPPRPDVSSAASHCWHADTAAAISDGLEPRSSSDRSIPRLTFWDHKGTTEWATLEFRKPRPVKACRAYFFEDASAGGGCKLPARWRVFYKDGDSWKPVAASTAGEPRKDGYSEIRFDTVTTSALKLELDLQPDASAGILECKVE